ncbi:MAG: uracil-DNA glycosylase [Acidobacteria bacterium]|nr:uracil-DNA glycosylase [Acidobacteriota bacterium]
MKDDPIIQLREHLKFYREIGVSFLKVEGKKERLLALEKETLSCRRCSLWKTRTKLVFGAGSPDAELMLIGEAPGYNEDKEGLPFVGQAGKLLNRILAAINLSRKEVYIANVLKCHPPGNRDPKPEEREACKPFLLKQIEIIKPKIILALGAHAARTLLETEAPISALRGRVWYFAGIPLIATFHPGFLLRNPGRKRDVWEDVKKVRAFLDEGRFPNEG